MEWFEIISFKYNLKLSKQFLLFYYNYSLGKQIVWAEKMV